MFDELKRSVHKNSDELDRVRYTLGSILAAVDWQRYCCEHDSINYEEKHDYSILGRLKRIDQDVFVVKENFVSMKERVKGISDTLYSICGTLSKMFDMVSAIYGTCVGEMGLADSTEVFVYKKYRDGTPEIFMNGKRVDCDKAKSISIYFNEGELPQITIDK